jgi:malto-oligosyltrehalose trehalohydrolase
MLVNPLSYRWEHDNWCGRSWEETVLYELHIGTFSPEGTFDGVRKRLAHLVDLGVTALELMPIADFSGTRNWGYDGVLPFAPDTAYGKPYDLRRLIDAAHGCGLMVFLDVVYNHFGPDGNYLNVYAPQFFTERHQTPWGAAIDFTRREVRDYFIHNALYWLEEYMFDGLRFDAVHAIIDETSPDILTEIADAVHRHFKDKRHVHLVLENENNESHYLTPSQNGTPACFAAQWNDDIHHAFHVLATGESAAYYEDYVARPIDHLCRCLTEGFAYQGEAFRHRDGKPRGEPSGHLPLTAFVSFLQNHDQVGNRAFGERISVLSKPEILRCLTSIMLLAPSPPMLFMGEEWGAREPFLFFCDFHDELADSVREGRRREFAKFPEFRDPAAREKIPDPNADGTFEMSKLDWMALDREPHFEWLELYRRLLAVRGHEIIPRLKGVDGQSATIERFAATGLRIVWRLADGSVLTLVANLGKALSKDGFHWPPGRLLYVSEPRAMSATPGDDLPAWLATWFLS